MTEDSRPPPDVPEIPDPFALLTRGREPAPAPEPAETPGAETEARGETASQSEAPAEPEPVPAEDPAPAEPQRRTEDPIQVVDYEELRDLCLHDKREGRKIILVVGLATAGKSFLVRRLISSMDDYHVSAHKGVPDMAEGPIDRTKEILRHGLARPGKVTSPDNLTIFDIPGDIFVRLVRAGYVVAPEDRAARLVYTIFCFADAIVFVEPALQVLMPEHYLEHGDQLGLDAAERKLRIDDLRYFILSVRPMTQIIGLLRDGMKHSLGGGRGAPETQVRAVDAVVERVLAIKNPEMEASKLKTLRLPMPGLLLLSRGDELQDQIESETGKQVFDRDPALELLRRERRHFIHLAASFRAFSVDFVTPAEGHEPGKDFDPWEGHYGAGRLMEDWILPSIAACNPPWWQRWASFIAGPQSPGWAIWWRRLLDADFRKAWNAKS